MCIQITMEEHVFSSAFTFRSAEVLLYGSVCKQGHVSLPKVRMTPQLSSVCLKFLNGKLHKYAYYNCLTMICLQMHMFIHVFYKLLRCSYFIIIILNLYSALNEVSLKCYTYSVECVFCKSEWQVCRALIVYNQLIEVIRHLS